MTDNHEFLDAMVDAPEKADTKPEENNAVLAVGPVAKNDLELRLYMKCQAEMRSFADDCGFSAVVFVIEDEDGGETEEVSNGERYATDEEQAALNAIQLRWQNAIAAARALGHDGTTGSHSRNPAWDDPSNQELIRILKEEWLR